MARVAIVVVVLVRLLRLEVRNTPLDAWHVLSVLDALRLCCRFLRRTVREATPRSSRHYHRRSPGVALVACQ